MRGELLSTHFLFFLFMVGEKLEFSRFHSGTLRKRKQPPEGPFSAKVGWNFLLYFPSSRIQVVFPGASRVVVNSMVLPLTISVALEKPLVNSSKRFILRVLESLF